MKLLAQLERASKALDEKPEAALQALVAAWSARPLPELAALVSRFEAAHQPPVFDGDTKAFKALAKKPSTLEVGALARAIVANTTAETIERLNALSPLRDDPRISHALLELVKLVPWTSDGARPVWTKAFELISRIADPRLLQLAPTLPAEWKFRENHRAFMATQLRRAVEAVTATRTKTALAPLTKPETEALEALTARLKPPKKAAQADAASLLAAIHANPDDDAARLVYADWCLERSDPHGEFITLQFKADKSKAELKREAELQKKHGAKWLGALAKVTLKDVTFRRGFPSQVVARFKGQRDVEQFGDAADWATIEDLSWSLPGAWSNDEARWLEHLPRRARPRTLAVHGHGFAQLLEGKTAWGIERLTVTARDVEVMRRFAASALFPKLSRLRVNGDFPMKFLTHGWLRDVPDVGVTTHGNQLLPWLEAMSHRQTFTVEHSIAGTFAFSRDDAGALSRLHVIAKRGAERFVLTVVNELPVGFLTSLTAEGVNQTVRDALTRLVRAPGGKAPVVTPKVENVRFITAHQQGEQWAVVRRDAFQVVDGRGEVLEDHPINETQVAGFSPDGKTVACCWDRRLEWRDGRTGALIDTEDVGEAILGVAWARSGQHLVLHLDKRLEVRAWPSGAIVRTVKSGQYPKKPAAVASSEDGAVLVAPQHTGDVHVHGNTVGKPFVFRPPKFVAAVAFVSSHEVVMSCVDEVRRVDLSAPDESLAEAPSPGFLRLVQSPDGRRIALGGLEATRPGKGVQVFDIQSLRQLLALEGVCKVLAFSADGTRLLVSDGVRLHVHSVR